MQPAEEQPDTSGGDANAPAGGQGGGEGETAAEASQQTETGGLLLGDLPYAEVIEWLALTVLVIGGLVAINYLILVRPTIDTRVKNQRRWIMLALTIVAALLVLIRLPVEDDTKKTIIQALGIAVTALITLSSTTIAANLMAGLMLGRVQAFKPGDVIRVVGSNGETFGRVTARGLFHVEVQTDERDLVTLPNSYVITHPVRVVRQSGTIITCDVGIGYDVPHGKLETLLVEAATESGLSDAYVLVRELGDFSVLYRAAGFLKDTKSILSARSRLRTHILDSLHGAGVEIVSPTFMNQRRAEDPVIAVHESEDEKKARSAESPESIVFDKADDAERVERVRKALDEARKSLKSLEAELSDASDDERKAALKDDIEHQKTLIEYLTSRVGRLEEQKPADDE